MVVKVIKSSNPSYWYAGFIGQVFTVEPVSEFDEYDKCYKYTVVPTPGTDALYMISVHDCQML